MKAEFQFHYPKASGSSVQAPDHGPGEVTLSPEGEMTIFLSKKHWDRDYLVKARRIRCDAYHGVDGDVDAYWNQLQPNLYCGIWYEAGGEHHFSFLLEAENGFGGTDAIIDL